MEKEKQKNWLGGLWSAMNRNIEQNMVYPGGTLPDVTVTGDKYAEARKKIAAINDFVRHFSNDSNRQIDREYIVKNYIIPTVRNLAKEKALETIRKPQELTIEGLATAPLGYLGGAKAAKAASKLVSGVKNVLTPGSAFWNNPLTKGMAASIAGGNGIDAASKFLTGNTWGENVGGLIERTTGWNPRSNAVGEFVTDVSNPGYLLSYGRAAKGVESAVENIVKARDLFNSPLTGKWTQIGNKEYRLSPNVLAGNIPVPESRPAAPSSAEILYKLKKGKMTVQELSKYVSETDARWVINNAKWGIAPENEKRVYAIVDKAAKNIKNKRGSNIEINAAKKAQKAGTSKGQVESIREEYKDRIEQIKKDTGIDWSDLSGSIQGMPDELKMSKVGFDKDTPFLKRYYENVMKITKKGGLQDQLLKSGELRINNNKEWEGLVNGKYQKVRPEDYIKMRIANQKGLTEYSMAPIAREGTSFTPMHGTKSKAWKYLTDPSASPGRSGYWTVIQNKKESSGNVISHYKGEGASVPFFRMPAYEDRPIKINSSSNSVQGSGMELKDYVNVHPGRITIPTGVSDPTGSGARISEYDFGPNVPNPKSLWNTLDFEPGAGPLSYNVLYNEDENTLPNNILLDINYYT